MSDSSAPPEREKRLRGGGLPGLILWPIGAMLFLNQLLVALADPHLGEDLLTFRQAAIVFLAHGSPYPVAPQANPFIFPPSALLFFVPLAAIPAGVAKYGYLLIQAAAFLAAGAISLRTFDIPWRSHAGGAMLLGISLYVGLETNLAFSNVNGLLVLAEALFLMLASRGRWLAAGTTLGLALAVKPSVVGLLLIPAIWRRWRSLALAVVIPAGLSALVIPFLARKDVLLTQVLPYLLHGEADVFPQYNASLTGAAAELHMGAILLTGLRIAVVLVGAVAIAARMLTPVENRLRLVEVAGIIVLVTLLASSFSWPTYGWLLLPLTASVSQANALIRSVAAWIAIYLFTSPMSSLTPFGSGDFGVLHLRFTAGYLGLLLVMGVAAVAAAQQSYARGVPKRSADTTWSKGFRFFLPRIFRLG